MLCALEVIDPSKTVEKFLLGDSSVENKSLHIEGNNDGVSVSLAVYNGLKSDDPNQKVVMAREMVDMFAGTLGSNGGLAGALITLTIVDYLKRRWG